MLPRGPEPAAGPAAAATGSRAQCAARDRRALAALALFVALTALHTWPLATAPGTLGRTDNADAQLNAWVLAWVAHQVGRDPVHLFDANIFYPERNTLAFSEHLFVPAMLGAPLSWAGAPPVLVHNLVLLAGMALTGWATSLVLARWTGSWRAGVLAGSVAAFNAHTLTRLPHVQAMHVEFLPLALLALDRLLERPRVRTSLALAVSYALQALCSGYLLVFTTLALGVGALVRASEWLAPSRAKRALPAIALAAVIAAVICAPFLRPYAVARSEQGLRRSMSEVTMFSASLRDYWTTGSRLHGALWTRRVPRGQDSLFPGVVPLALGLGAIVSGLAWRDRRARLLLAAGAAAFVCSFGPKVPVYGWLYEWLTPLQGLRGAARFGYLVIFAVGGLAAFALAALERAWRQHAPRLAAWSAVALVAAVNLEAARAPLGYTRFEGIPRVYDVLATVDHAVVAEVPFPPANRTPRNAALVLASTRHWHPLLNGYSGFVPESYVRHAEELAGFPDARAMATLRRLGVTHVVVHVRRGPALEAELRDRPEFVLLAAGPEQRVYRLAD